MFLSFRSSLQLLNPLPHFSLTCSLTTATSQSKLPKLQSYYPRSSVLPFQVLFVGKKRGKGAIATRLIDKDEIVIHDEQPLASGQVLINKRHVLACAHCMRFLEYHPYSVVWELPYSKSFRVQPYSTIIECDNRCNSAYYCSIQCKTEAWEKYHKYLCPSIHPEILKLYKEWRSVEKIWKDVFPLLSPSMIVKIVAQYTASLRSPELNERLSLPYSKHTLSDYISILSTTPLFTEELPEWTKAIQQMTNLLSKIFPEMSSSNQELSKLEDIVRRLVYNSRPIEIQVTPSLDNYIEAASAKKRKYPKSKLRAIQLRFFIEETNDVRLFWQPVGSALYFLQACFNHSCQPNASARVDVTHHQDIIALERINEGTEITISYLPEELLQTPYPIRQKWIRNLFGFECMCTRCVRGK